MGSFVPWLYYGFYCHYQPKVIYLSVVCVLGVLSIVVSLWDKFSEPNLRPLRAGVFMSFGLSGIIPAIHYGLMEGWFSKISQASLGWLVLMGEEIWKLNIMWLILTLVPLNFRSSLYSGGAVLCDARTWEVVPWQIWYMGKFYGFLSWLLFLPCDPFTVPITSNIPRVSDSCCVRTLPWYHRDGDVQSDGWWMHSSSSSHRLLNRTIIHNRAEVAKNLNWG